MCTFVFTSSAKKCILIKELVLLKSDSNSFYCSRHISSVQSEISIDNELKYLAHNFCYRPKVVLVIKGIRLKESWRNIWITQSESIKNKTYEKRWNQSTWYKTRDITFSMRIREKWTLLNNCDTQTIQATWYDIFINYNWVVTRWQQYSTHLHTNNTQNNTKQTIHRTTQQFGRVRAVSRLD